MTEPWPMGEDFLCWFVDPPDAARARFATEAEAHRYAATPLLIEAVKNLLRFRDDCPWCRSHLLSQSVSIHEPDCLGIAALRAAGETP